MEFIKKNKSIIIVFLVVLILNAGLIFVLVNFLYGRVKDKVNMVEQNKQRLENIKKEGEKWEDYRKKREELEGDRELLENSMVKSETQINLIERLEQIATEENVKVEIQSQKEIAVKDKKTKTKDAKKEEDNGESFSVIVDGEYNEILDYLYKLENLNYVFNIVSSNIKTRSAVTTLRNQEQQVEENPKSLQAKFIISFVFQK